MRDVQPAAVISESERAQLLALAEDLPRAWSHPAASAETRKRLLRAVLEEIIVNVEQMQFRLKLHWKGGDHTALNCPRPGMASIGGRRARRPSCLFVISLVCCPTAASRRS